MTFSEALSWAQSRLESAGIRYSKRESELLLTAFLKNDISEILLNPNKEVPDEHEFKKWVARRSCKEPLQYIMGYVDFYGFTFKIERGVFIPRPETELLVEEALKVLCGNTLLDLGTGCGNILLSILANASGMFGVGVDISKKALDIARQNAERIGLKERALFLESDWGEGLDGWFSFDLIVSNPPYIPKPDIRTLDSEIILYEPLDALMGGEDGLLFYRRTIEIAKKLLRKEGKLILELGGKAVIDFLSKTSSFELVSVRKDYSGNERVAVLQRR